MNGDLGPAFVDTNILVYAMAKDDEVRAPIARDLLRRLMRAQFLHVKTQVLQELFATLTRKGQRRFSPAQALRYVDRVAAYNVATIDYPAIRAAMELSASEPLSFWDALILVAASRSRAEILYTEDLQDGRTMLGVRIVNPFRLGPAVR